MLLFLALVPFVHDARAASTARQAAPNVVILLADDLGYGDLAAYGHPVHRTPNLDRLALEGQRWTDFYSAAPVCTPSRGALLTGRLPARIGLEAPRGVPNVFFSFSTGGLPHSELTLPQLLKQAGYATALIGKWHLGYTPEHAPTRHGFDYFFGTPSSNDHDPAGPFSMDLIFEEPKSAHWNVQLRRGDDVVELPARQETLTPRFTAEAIRFMRAHRKQPFFVTLAYTMPHAPLFASAGFRGRSAGGLYGDVIEELDDSVGQIVGALRELGLERDTIVVFTSDNGPMELFRERGGSAGPLRGGKGSTWEGGLRVPGIFWGPGRVKPGTVHGIGSQLDLLPTLLDLAGRSPPQDRALDGSSLRETLGSLAPSPRQQLPYYRQGELYALRSGPYKAHFVTEEGYGEDTGRTVRQAPLIFNLAQDPAERFPIESPDPALSARFAALKQALERDVMPAPSELLKGFPPANPAR